MIEYRTKHDYIKYKMNLPFKAQLLGIAMAQKKTINPLYEFDKAYEGILNDEKVIKHGKWNEGENVTILIFGNEKAMFTEVIGYEETVYLQYIGSEIEFKKYDGREGIYD